ncbi:MAG TPA: folylpolyglutamate synthase/dihydrofolate synthase family protein [bacterium]|nr:folylpolyglutamate synthase/dihydrofolate synthase family protein [bacterium]HPN42933.1 folylpolyglutamate synthase/dihydrofolate synthase family protein [bacterium]
MNYQQAVDYLYGLERFGWKLGLDRMRTLMDSLDNPQDKIRYIHIAGTNGKGSVAAMVESVLRSAGYRTGLYTSPHLQNVRERIRLDGAMITEQEFASIMTRLKPVCDDMQCTFFEVITALAFVSFASYPVDYVALETGLGGRLDATNIIKPMVSVFTGIDLEHTEHLGTEIAMIAHEKAGIIKSGVPCVIGQLPAAAEQEIINTCKQNNSALVRAEQRCRCDRVTLLSGSTDFDLTIDHKLIGRISLPLPGMHQAANAQIAAAALAVLRDNNVTIQNQSFSDGLSSVCWPGRLQTVCTDPYIIIDVAHNPAAFAQLAAHLHKVFADYQIKFIFGLLKDKDLPASVQILAPLAQAVYIVRVESERSLDPEIIAQQFGGRVPVQTFSTVKAGFRHAIQDYQPGQLFCVTGSHYLVGEVLDEINNLTR